jgi:hypothetical protein
VCICMKQWFLLTSRHCIKSQGNNTIIITTMTTSNVYVIHDTTSALKMEAVYFYETMVFTDESSRYQLPKEQRFKPLCHALYIFSPEDGNSMLLRNVGIYLHVITISKPKRTTSYTSLMCLPLLTGMKPSVRSFILFNPHIWDSSM